MDAEHHDKEVRDRLRRIETRLTKYLEQQGFDTQRKLPVWKGSSIEIPSMECAVADILAAIPDPCNVRHIAVTHKGTDLFVITDY